MKFSRRLTITKDRCPPELFESIVRIKPECYAGGGSFHLETQPGDEVAAKLVDELVALCEQSGLKKNVRGTIGAYTHQVHFHYEQTDLQAAPLLWLMGQRRVFKSINSGERDELGRVWLPATEAKPTVKFASVFLRPWIVVSDWTRRILESAGLVGLKFDEVSIKGHSDQASKEPFWELRSVVSLPKMTNSDPDTGVNYESFLISDAYGEPHYRQSDLQPLGIFDIAHTKEPLGGHRDPSLIVSQRFYQHCLKHKIPLEVRPVRIDPD